MLSVFAWIGRTLLALVISRVCVAIGLICWVNATLWLAYAMRLSPVMYDTVLLSLPFAVYPVDAGIGLLSLPPLLLACWPRRQTLKRRALAALAGMFLGLGLVLVWQATVSWWTGYVFVQRYAIPNPLTQVDYAVLALIASLEAWLTLRVIPWKAKAAFTTKKS